MTQVNKVMFQEYGNDFSAVTKGLCTTEEINKLKVENFQYDKKVFKYVYNCNQTMVIAQ